MAGAFEEEDPCVGTDSQTLSLFVPFRHPWWAESAWAGRLIWVPLAKCLQWFYKLSKQDTPRCLNRGNLRCPALPHGSPHEVPSLAQVAPALLLYRGGDHGSGGDQFESRI